MDARKFVKLNASIVINTLRELIMNESCQVNYAQAECLVQSIKNNTSIRSLSFLNVPEEVISYLLLAFVHHPALKKVVIRNKRLSLDFALTLLIFLNENQSVVELDMAECDMTDDHLNVLSPAFSSNSTLSSLTLKKNKLTKKSAFLFFSHLAKNISIKDINLIDNLFDDEAIPYLNLFLKSNSTLQNIALDGNWLSPKGAINFQLYDGMSNVRRISLANNAIGDIGIIRFAREMGIGRDILKWVDISNNFITASGFSHVVAALKSSSSLRFFACSVNVIGDVGAVQLADLITTCERLETVFAYDCGFGRYGVFQISHAVASHPSITHVNLGYADFSGYALAGLTLAFKVNFLVNIIDISNCNIGGEIVPFLDAILHHPLTMLFLSNNRIGAVGAEALARLLRKNRSLEVLSISDNNLTDNDGALIAAALVSNSVLNYLNLAHNHFSSETAFELAAMLKGNAALTALQLSHNLFDTSAVLLLLETLRSNATLRLIDLQQCLITQDWLYRNGRMYRAEEVIIDLLKQNHGICEFTLDSDVFSADFTAHLSELLEINRKIERLLCNYHSDVAVIVNKIQSLIISKGALASVVEFPTIKEQAFLRCMQYACVNGRISRDDFTRLMKGPIFAGSDLAVFFNKIKSLFINKYNPGHQLYRIGLFSPTTAEGKKAEPPFIKLSLNFS